MERSG